MVHPTNILQTKPGTKQTPVPTNPTTNPREAWIGTKSVDWNKEVDHVFKEEIKALANSFKIGSQGSSKK